ncbi:MAG: Gfo/Idh/MocA family oxidoreductase [Isosphaeraceae bacterium]
MGAAAAFPAIVPASAIARPGRVAPGDRIAVAIIGCGKMANDYHIPELLKFEDVQVSAVCEVDSKRREHALGRVEKTYEGKDRAGGCASVSDFREIIGRKDIDAVCIATPEHWHAIPAIEAMKAGKDVYCEKPLTLTLAEGKRCIDAARKYGRVFQTGSQQRSGAFGSFREAAEIVRSGRLGNIQVVTVGVGGPAKPCDLPGEDMEPGLDWNLWLGPAPDRPYNSILSPRGLHKHFPAWREYREYAGGGLADMGAHHFDIAQWCLGMDESGPVEVIPPIDPKSGHGAIFRYANGVTMIHGGPSGCTFTGSKGTLRIDRGHLSSDPEGIVKEPLSDKEVHIPKSPGHHRNWVDCIKSREKPVADVEIGARSVAITILGNLAYWHRRPLKWDPKGWKFVDDPVADRWLDRERRDPWQLPSI